MDHVSPPRVLLLTLAALCLSAMLAVGQDVALPQSSPAEPAEPISPTPTPPGAPTPIPPPQIIPPDVLPMPDIGALPGNKPPSMPTIQQLDEELKPKQISQAAEDYRMKIEWRKLRNQAQNDPAIIAALRAAERARTDLEKRALLGRYFNLLYDKMIAQGRPEMKAYLNDRRREQLGTLPQPRVRPSSKLPPPPKPDATAKLPQTAPPSAPALPLTAPAASPSASPAKSP